MRRAFDDCNDMPRRSGRAIARFTHRFNVAAKSFDRVAGRGRQRNCGNTQCDKNFPEHIVLFTRHLRRSVS